jgi:3-oxoacyl-[acyl-carrier-protein] synthase II
MITNIIAGQVAIRYGFKGPNFCITSACSSATHSIGEALRIVQHGEADVMLAGGTEAAITVLGLGGFCALRALTTRNDDPLHASRPFDADRDGFLMGEGAGVLVIESEDRAKARGATIYCELAGYGRTCDAYHITAPDPDAAQAARGMRLAFEDAGLQAEDIDYINAHGTSTSLNDKGETAAIKKALGEELAYKVAISSTKSMTGHLLGAAGGVEAIACAMAIKEGITFRTLPVKWTCAPHSATPSDSAGITPRSALKRPDGSWREVTRRSLLGFLNPAAVRCHPFFGRPKASLWRRTTQTSRVPGSP